MIRPQPLLAPRPNVRKHPLDYWEKQMIEDGDLETDPHPNGKDLAIAVAVMLASAAVSGWALWKIGEWVVG